MREHEASHRPSDLAASTHPDDERVRTGAQVMCEALIRGGVEVLFGIPGGAIMPFYHALFAYRDQLHHVLCRHEQGAGHAAEGYARATGRLGVCVGTSGPGATNLVTPITDAYMDSTPLLAITGQVLSTLIGTDAFQETDITGITLPVTKHSYLVDDVRDLPRVFDEAMYLAQSGRPGPVLIDVAKDCQQARCVPEWNVVRGLPGYTVAPAPHRAAVEQAAALLASARRPLILAGAGVNRPGAADALRAFAELAEIPVVTTLHGLGAFPDDHPLCLGMPGMHGWVHVNRAIQRCDAILAVGMRFDDRVTGNVASFAPNARVVHVDIDKGELNKLVRAEVAIHADAGATLVALHDAVRERMRGMTSNPRLGMIRDMSCETPLSGATPSGATPSDTPPAGDALGRARWLQEIARLRAEFPQRLPRPARRKEQEAGREAGMDVRVTTPTTADPSIAPLAPHDVYDALDRMLRARGSYRVVTDVGQHQMWAAQLIRWERPRTHITSGGAGTMGFALPAALGVALACPDETVWVVCGDGGFQMTNQELATMRQEGVRNVKIAIINNGYLGMVRQWQQLFERRVYSNTPLSGPNFARLAEAYGVPGFTVVRREDVQSALDTAYATDGPVLIDFRVEREVNVFPIVPQGKSIGEMLVAEPEVERVNAASVSARRVTHGAVA